MLNRTYSTEKLSPVEIESLPDGGQFVRLRKNSVTIVDSEGTQYCCDEVSFMPDRELTEETANTDDWWEYGKTWTPDAQTPSVEDRLSNLEDAMMALLMF